MAVFSRDRPLSLTLALTCLLSGSALSLITSRLAIAQSFPTLRSMALPQQVVIPAGTRLPLRALAYSKILVAKNETFPLSLTLSTDLRDRRGLIVIPEGSRIAGEIRPAKKGGQFFAQQLMIYSDSQLPREYPLQASSDIVTRTELVTTSTRTAQIAKGTLIGRVAANLIAEITGDRTLVSEATPPDKGIGLLAGWFLNATKAELIAINPNRDLTLTLDADLTLNSTLSHSRTRSLTLAANR